MLVTDYASSFILKSYGLQPPYENLSKVWRPMSPDGFMNSWIIDVNPYTAYNLIQSLFYFYSLGGNITDLKLLKIHFSIVYLQNC